MTGAARVTISMNMSRFDRIEAASGVSPAAVAILLMQSPRELCIPMLQRPTTMSRHAGQMALPGGRSDAGESAEDCAIREVNEELGLTVEHRDILGKLDDFTTRSGFTITPVVVWSEANPPALRPSQAEVRRLFVVGSEELRQAVAASTPGASAAFSLRFREVEVFAPTAAILYQFSEVALDGRSCRVADFYQPPFTHR
jgi:8-oxo-dGTP pyrophosphatase MutT (NUDIX family)